MIYIFLCNYFRLKTIWRLNLKSLVPVDGSLKNKDLVLHALIFFSVRSVTLEPAVTSTIETDIGVKFSKKYVWRLYPRSGLSCISVILGEGVIYSDFQGNVCVILTNISRRLIDIETGDRIAETLFLKPVEVEFVKAEELDKTERGIHGFCF